MTVPSMGYALVQEPLVAPQPVKVYEGVSTMQISSGLCSPCQRLFEEKSKKSTY